MIKNSNKMVCIKFKIHQCRFRCFHEETAIVDFHVNNINKKTCDVVLGYKDMFFNKLLSSSYKIDFSAMKNMFRDGRIFIK